MEITTRVLVTLITLSFLSIVALTTATDFVGDKCKGTRYPDLCVKILTPHAKDINTSQVKLARVALSVAIAKGKETKLSLGNSKDPALKDCAEEFSSSLQQLQDSVAELDKINIPGKFEWHKSNAQTWVSAAMTNFGDCEGTEMSLQVTEVDQLTSIALKFINEIVEDTKHL